MKWLILALVILTGAWVLAFLRGHAIMREKRRQSRERYYLRRRR